MKTFIVNSTKKDRYGQKVEMTGTRQSVNAYTLCETLKVEGWEKSTIKEG
jgi:hypothetical protein